MKANTRKPLNCAQDIPAEKTSATPATEWLRGQGVPFVARAYDYVDAGGALEAARQLGLDAHIVVKTLVMEDEGGTPLIVLMHGDCEVSTKALARGVGVKSVAACKPAIAQRHSGYLVGGTSPFGTRRTMSVFAPASVLALPELWINAGRRGLLLRLSGADLQQYAQVRTVDCALEKA